MLQVFHLGFKEGIYQGLIVTTIAGLYFYVNPFLKKWFNSIDENLKKRLKRGTLITIFVVLLILPIINSYLIFLSAGAVSFYLFYYFTKNY
tara:strand:- start:79 stop:351 length:273 start_codon:yes stop_codon:yes gene_type:complete